MTTTEPTLVPAGADADERLIWIGEDDRGIELEIVALVLPRRRHRHPRHAHGAQEAEMTTKPRRAPSSTVGRGEKLRDSHGRVIDDEYVDRAVEGAIAYVRGRGRPSLSESGESPLLRVRVSRDLDAAVRQAARTSGESAADWVRRTLESATRHSR